MGDYADFCESYGGSASDPDFMDKWLDQYASGTESLDKYISKSEEIKFKSKYNLPDKAWSQIKEYVFIFKKNSLRKHHEVNSHITEHGLWDNFTEIRSMNDHGNDKIVHGITRMHFKVICQILEITGGNGDPLIKSEKY